MMMPGGLSEERSADNDVQELIEKVREAAEEKAGKSFAQYTAVSYSTQVVAGTNYFVKVNVGGEHVHLRVFVPLPYTRKEPALTSLQLGKTEEDPIVYF